MSTGQEKIVGFFYLKVFVIVFVLVVFGASLVKIISEISLSTFRNNSYTLLYVSNDSKIINVDKDGKRAAFLAVGDMRKFVKGKSAIEVSFALGIPINCMITADTVHFRNLDEFTSFGNETNLVFGNKVYKNCNRYDMHKLISAARAVPEDNRFVKRINLFNTEREIMEESFKDSIITNMDYTVEINNGTSVNGLGSELALILGRVGFNVVVVKTAQKSDESFIAFEGEKSSYLDTLTGLTNFPVRRERLSKAADITIQLGEDLDIILNQ